MEHSINGFPFVIYESPYCLWGVDLERRNLEFIENIDPEYFEYLADTHFNKSEDDDEKRAVIALRTAYHHGLETLFALLCATIQAPHCVIGWIQKYKPGHLRKILSAINAYGKLPNQLNIDRLSWDTLSERINLFSYEEKKLLEIRQLFSKLWSGLASEYINSYNIKEYNSIKHGFRAKSGGFKLAIGLEKEYGVPCPPEKMQYLGGSDYGTSFFSEEKIEGCPEKGEDVHFYTRRCAVNWNPEAIAYSLCLISMSINNVVSFLKIKNGINPKTVKFVNPEDKSVFEKPWDFSVGVPHCNMDFVVYEQQIKRLSKTEILEHINRAINHK